MYSRLSGERDGGRWREMEGVKEREDVVSGMLRNVVKYLPGCVGVYTGIV